MKPLHLEYLNNITLQVDQSGGNEENIIINEKNNLPSPLFELPSGYIGKILLTIYPYVDENNPSSYSFYLGSEYTIKIYKKVFDENNSSEITNILLKEESFLCSNDYIAMQIETHSFNENDNGSLFATIQTNGGGTNTEETLLFYASVFLTTIEDSENRVDIGKIAGVDATVPSPDDFASKILKNPNNLLYSDENGKVEMSGIDGIDIVNAIMESTINNEDGGFTVQKILQILAAWTAGNWRNKTGSLGEYEILDPDNKTTVIMEIIPKKESPYKTVSIRNI